MAVGTLRCAQSDSGGDGGTDTNSNIDSGSNSGTIHNPYAATDVAPADLEVELPPGFWKEGAATDPYMARGNAVVPAERSNGGCWNLPEHGIAPMDAFVAAVGVLEDY